eukprot:1810833-Amphidinium_carterae.2
MNKYELLRTTINKLVVVHFMELLMGFVAAGDNDAVRVVVRVVARVLVVASVVVLVLVGRGASSNVAVSCLFTLPATTAHPLGEIVGNLGVVSRQHMQKDDKAGLTRIADEPSLHVPGTSLPIDASAAS